MTSQSSTGKSQKVSVRSAVIRKELKMYSPKIEPRQVKKLHLLKLSYVSLGINKPMTRIVREALDEYIPKAVKEILESGGHLLIPDELTDN